MDEYLNIAAEHQFYKRTSPKEVQKLLENLKKVDKDFVKYAKVLSEPLAVLINMILKTHYYPKAFRVSKCTLLPERAIFSLSPIPKVVELVIKGGIDKLKPDDDGTGQMAFTKNRGTELCLAMMIFNMQ